MNKPPRLHWAIGIGLGVLAALVLMPLLGGPGKSNESTVGSAFSDCDGQLHELVIQYTPDSAHIVKGPYKSFLSQLPEDVTVHVICRNPADFGDISTHVGPVACRLNPVYANHEMTSWARDRWVGLYPAGESSAITLLSPQGELAADVWAARKGDEQIGETLADSLDPDVVAVRSELYFDGGDLVGDDETYFVTPNVTRRNVQNTVETKADLTERLAEILGRKIVLLNDAPDHHACMFMMPAGDKTVVVGDPHMARDLLSAEEETALPIPEGADFSDATQARFDAVAKQCADAGYRVVRIPLAPGKDGRVFLTPINAILDQRDDERIVYMPVFANSERLNAASTKVWADLGFTVKPVDCTDCYKYFGSLRCLVNVLRRD